jgi:hypothetical protein
MSGHIHMQNPAGRKFHDDEDVEEAKSRCDHHAEVARNNRLGMIPHKGHPAL